MPSSLIGSLKTCEASQLYKTVSKSHPLISTPKCVFLLMFIAQCLLHEAVPRSKAFVSLVRWSTLLEPFTASNSFTPGTKVHTSFLVPTFSLALVHSSWVVTLCSVELCLCPNIHPRVELLDHIVTLCSTF